MVGDDNPVYYYRTYVTINHRWVLIMSMYHNRPGHVYLLGEPFVVRQFTDGGQLVMIQAHINNTTRNGWTVVSIGQGGMSRIHSMTYIGRICIWEVSDYSRASSS